MFCCRDGRKRKIAREEEIPELTARKPLTVVHVNQEHPDRIAESPATVLSHQDWIILFVVMVDVNREHPVRVAEPPATVLCHKDWSILFVVKGSANVVYAGIFAVKTVTVFQDYIVIMGPAFSTIVMTSLLAEKASNFFWYDIVVISSTAAAPFIVFS